MRKSFLIGVLFGALSLLVLAALGERAGLVSDLVPRASSAGPWLVSRAAGVTAYVALSLEVLFGLFVSTGAGDRWIRRADVVEVHRWLSSVALFLVGLHAFALLGDHVARLDALDLLVPFVAEVRRGAVALGVLAAWSMLVVHASFAWRGLIGARAWRRLHYLTFALYAGATAHGLSAGSDAGEPWLLATYATSVIGVVSLASLRIAGGARRAKASETSARRPPGEISARPA